MTDFTQQTMSADNLCDRITQLADTVYIKHDGKWQLITHIQNHQVIDGVWISDDFIHIELNETTEIKIHKYDNVEIRYDENEGEKVDDDRIIIHREWLDDFNYLEVIDKPINEPERYVWRIRFFNETGEYFGSNSNAQWHDTKASALADARIHYLTEIKDLDA